MIEDQRALCPHFVRFAMNAHQGVNGSKSKSEFVFFAKQASTYETAAFLPNGWRPTTAAECSRVYDGVDLSPIITNPATNSCMTFTSTFCYLGSLLDTTLNDLKDANHRIQKASQGFGLLSTPFFRSRSFSHTTKRVVFEALIASICLYGCESWSVTAEMERRLRSMQTQCCKQILNISTATMIANHISAAEMRNCLGMTDIVQRMRVLQLTWLGRVRRMPLTRLPRKFLVSWLPCPRLSNYPQTYSQSVLKALASIGVSEADWPSLAANEREWNRWIRQPPNDRTALNVDLASRSGGGTVSAFNRSIAHISSSVAGLNFANSPASVRRREWALGGGVATPARENATRDDLSIEVPDLRSIDPRNCYDPSLSPSVYPSSSPESINAQLLLDVGVGHRLDVRLSQCGIFYWRRETEQRNPDHCYSWMRPADDDDRYFSTSSFRPSTSAPVNPPHRPTYESYRPLNPDAMPFDPANRRLQY